MSLDPQHVAVWAAIDDVAVRLNLSRSGLARRIGYDSTAFNLSKRVGTDGRTRWPGTETIALVLNLAGMTWAEWGALVDQHLKDGLA